MTNPAAPPFLAAARRRPTRSGWHSASLTLFHQYWGTGTPPPAPGSFTYSIHRGLTSLAHAAFTTDRAASAAFVRAGWKHRANAPHAPYRNNDAMLAGVALTAANYRASLHPVPASLLHALLTFYDLEGIVRPHLCLVNGLASIAVGAPQTVQQVVVEPSRHGRLGKLKALDDVLNDTKALLGRLQSTSGVKSAVPGVRNLVQSISPRVVNAATKRVGLADLRNMIAHHDFDIRPNGNLRIGLNSYARLGLKSPRTMSAAVLDENLTKLAGLNATLCAWSAFAHAMV